MARKVERWKIMMVVAGKQGKERRRKQDDKDDKACGVRL
jgi:hypothetical protein